MKTIRIFIASSAELTPERKEFDTLFNHLNTIYRKRGIYLEPVKWEFLGRSMGVEHKQEEYNREIRDCDICVVMFWQSFGEYTKTELDVADAELRNNRRLSQIYVFFKEPGDYVDNLKSFKDDFERAYEHFYCRFDTIDKLQLDFVLELEKFLSSNCLKVENSVVMLDSVAIAHLDNIGFAAGNEKFKALRDSLARLDVEIAQLEEVCRVTPNAVIENMVNDKKRERSAKREELSQHEQILLGSAIKISQFAGRRVSERMKRAVALFEQGKVSEANVVLDEAERDADDILNGIKAIKSVGRDSVDELLLRTSTMIADDKYTIEERVERVKAIYAKADEIAAEANYDEKKYHDLLFAYGDFLCKYAKYDEALDIYRRALALSEKLNGDNHQDAATTYNNIGGVYHSKGDYDGALDYYKKALVIYENELGLDHPYTATTYNNIGNVYHNKGDYDKALMYYFKDLAISEKVLGLEHPDTATSYNNIGSVYDSKGDYAEALEYYFKALAIREKVLGLEHPDTAASYSNIGLVYDSKGDYAEALEYYFKALAIREKVLGLEHPDTANSYNNIGLVYDNKGDYAEALEYYFKALAIHEKVLGLEHPSTATLYNNIGLVYDGKGDYAEALEYYFKDLAISEKVLGLEHPSTATSYNNIGGVYDSKGDYAEALEYYFKALAIHEKVLGLEHPSTATSYNNIGNIYVQMSEYKKASDYHKKALAIREKRLGIDHLDTADSCVSIGIIYFGTGYEDKALEYLQRALPIYEQKLGVDHPNTQRVIEFIEEVKSSI